jgi:quinol monooxygenase YgiN
MEYPSEATFYVRLSLMSPREGMRDRLLEEHRKLVEWLQDQPGFVRGFVIEEEDPDGRVGHLNIYRSEEDADRVAQTDHVLAVRSELMMLIEEGSRVEDSFHSYDPELAKGSK